jgi:hypothetical protein
MPNADAPVEAGRTDMTMDQAIKADWRDSDEPLAETAPDGDKPVGGEGAEAASAEGVQPLEQQAEEEPASEEVAAEPVRDDVTVTMRDGSKLTLADLKQGYESRENLTRATQQVADRQREIAGRAEELTGVIENIGNWIAARIPPEPDPQLAWTDPNRHYREALMRQQALSEYAGLLRVRDGTADLKQQLTAADFAQSLENENAKLVKALPQLADTAKLEAFSKRVNVTAKTLGFTDQEIAQTSDHRIRMLVHYAALGKEAEAARAKVQVKVSAAAPTLPAKTRAHPNSQAALANVNAMKRLEKTGSIRDAMKVDFVD